MTNHFSSLLLNLSYNGDTLLIAPGFVARRLEEPFSIIYNILFRSDITRQQKYNLCQAYLELLQGAGLEEVFTLIDSRVIYELGNDFANFKTAGLNIAPIFTSLTQSNQIITKLFSNPKFVDTDKYDNLWNFNTNPIYRVAGLLAAYVIRLS